jgi:ABC-type glycerol-3-phosphate transport system substrate-binding protein
VDGEVPFAEAAVCMIPATRRFEALALGDARGPFEVHLAAGEHTVSLEVESSRLLPLLEVAQEVMAGIRELAVGIRKVTGGSLDRYRDWSLADHLPDLAGRLIRWADALDLAHDQAAPYLSVDGRARSRETLNLRLATRALRDLAQRPDEIPRHMTRLSEGSGSAAEILGDLVAQLQSQPLTLDALYLAGSEARVPRPGLPWHRRLLEGIRRIVTSFGRAAYVTKDSGTQNLRVWVNRPRQYVTLIQSMTDRDFSRKTGVDVTFSLMPEETKLILANAAGRQPDAVLGLASWLPFDLGVRGAAADLRRLPGFGRVIDRFSPGALLPFVIGDQVVALPETQDFWVLFYRRDILSALGLGVPDTWDDVKAMLPVLQRYGMSLYLPIAAAGAFKTFPTTAPFIYQTGGDFYTQDVTRTAIDSEAALEGVRLMTELFTLYSLPLSTPNFYASFRNGSVPIGVANFEVYVKLVTAAPEIAGWWGMAPHPGQATPAGVVRWAPGSAQSMLISSRSTRILDAWAFLDWWSSTPVQVEFQERLQSGWGSEYLWNSANGEAFRRLPIPREHRAVIDLQWRWMREVIRVPGNYMLERALSDAWNKIVLDGANPRSAVDDAVVTANREIARKLRELGPDGAGRWPASTQRADIALILGWREP